jgi:ribosomal protein S18 acetylase RimI-like enzyme
MSPAGAPADVSLREMTVEELEACLHRVTPIYAEMLVVEGMRTAAEAPGAAREELALRLPEGLATAGNRLLSVLSCGRRVGDIWLCFREEASERVCAVLYLYIEPDERRRGYARAAMRLAEEEARNGGATGMRLTVGGGNAVARALYDRLGYVVLNARLSKSIAPRDRHSRGHC